MKRRLALVLAFVAGIAGVACAHVDGDAADSTGSAESSGATVQAIDANDSVRHEVASKKATCPFAGTAVESGALQLLNAAKRPLAYVKDIVRLGDTGGGDLSNDGDCNCDTRIVRIDWKPLDATLTPR